MSLDYLVEILWTSDSLINNFARKILGDLAIKTFIHHDEVTMYKEIFDR